MRGEGRGWRPGSVKELGRGAGSATQWERRPLRRDAPPQPRGASPGPSTSRRHERRPRQPRPTNPPARQRRRRGVSHLNRKATPVMNRSSLRRTGAAGAALIALSLGLAACGDDSDSGSAASDDTTAAAATLLPTPMTSEAVDGRRRGCRDLRPRLLGHPDRRQGLLQRHGDRPGRDRREQQPAADHPGRRRQRRPRPGRHPERRAGADRVRADRRRVRARSPRRTSTPCWPTRPR